MASASITAYTATCAAGRGREAIAAALKARSTGLTANTFTSQSLKCFIGRVAGLEDAALPAELSAYDARNQRLAWLGLREDGFTEHAAAARERYGADRVAVVLGTSTSSIGETELAYRTLGEDGRFTPAQREKRVHEPHSLSAFVQVALGLRGPCLTVATACSSSAKVFASAERLLHAGLADAVLVGGVDTLCDSVLFGFNSLGLVSDEPCRPFDRDRNGLSLGEAAGFALLERAAQEGASRQGVDRHLRLIGYGESSDAHHMSSPHPQGLGAEHAIDDALVRAGLDAGQVDYINCHGTASRANDEVEAAVIARRFSARTRASSTKGWTGHTLGAAGILEAVITLISLEDGLIPGCLNTRVLDPVCGPQFILDNEKFPGDGGARRIALSNSFGFGGNNCCLAFAREATT
ncbi:MAG: beta-ketoacyl-[acyl-carrier-protein] synthase family protein [Rudaea sp.]